MKLSHAAKVGAFSLIALAIAAWFVMRIQHVRIGKTPGIHYTVMMVNAEGLQPKAWVLFKGVRVGRVTAISLAESGVAVRVSMMERVPLRQGATARIVNVGLLGEKQLEIVQGPEGAPLLENEGTIEGKPSASLDRVIGMANDIGEDVREVTKSVKTAIEGPDGGATRIDTLVENLTELTVELRQVVSENQKELRASMQSVQDTSAAVRRLANQVSALAERESASIDRTATNAAETSESLRRTAATLEAIANKLNQGDGTLGRLISSPETGERIDATLDSVKGGAEAVNHVVGGAREFGIGVGLRADYLATRNRAKGYLGLTLAPKGDWFLLLQAVSVPEGAEPANPKNDAEQPEPLRGDSLTWTVLAGYRFDWLQLRMGFIESRIGLGGDALLFDRRLRLSTDLWDISRDDLRPHARVEAALYPVRPFFVVGGWDDVLNAGRTDSVFFGAGLQFGP